jgi:uncharacterized membrane protein YesL
MIPCCYMNFYYFCDTLFIVPYLTIFQIPTANDLPHSFGLLSLSSLLTLILCHVLGLREYTTTSTVIHLMSLLLFRGELDQGPSIRHRYPVLLVCSIWFLMGLLYVLPFRSPTDIRLCHTLHRDVVGSRLLD